MLTRLYSRSHLLIVIIFQITELIDSYHHLAVREKADREWSKFVRKRNYMILLERYPVLNPRLRRYCSSSWTTPNRETEPAKKIHIPAAEAPAEPPKFDIEPFISQPLQLESSLENRGLQSVAIATQNAILTICNPAHRVTTVSLRQLTAEEEAEKLSHLLKTQYNSAIGDKRADGGGDAQKSEEKPKEAAAAVGSSGDEVDRKAATPCYSTVKLTLPSCEIKLAPRNDIAEYDEALAPNVAADYKDDPKVIAFRRGNKVGVRINLTPVVDVSKVRPTAACPLTPVREESESLFQEFEKDQLVPLRAAVCLHFDYKNTTTGLLSEQRAAAAAAAAAANASASAVKASTTGDGTSEGADGKGQSSSVVSGLTSPPGATDQIQQVDLVVLLNFGDMVLKN
ncbi:unnamed protein product [Echinostoma caproni]|uniref:PIH1 domain-containing protein n=1 Tax=Echinostoma caproni TaxID=27848 RepID=A0A183AGV2_9TREM|nr:unnamed protein product [Echinostoma caproni]